MTASAALSSWSLATAVDLDNAELAFSVPQPLLRHRERHVDPGRYHLAQRLLRNLDQTPKELLPAHARLMRPDVAAITLRRLPTADCRP
jgi:hypothetical protein